MNDHAGINVPGTPADAELLQLGLELLEEQHDAMLSHDAARLANANLRLGEWIDRMHQVADPRSARGATLAARAGKSDGGIGAALRANAQVAAGMRSQAARALDALVPAAAQVYEADGHKLARLPDRGSVRV